ncbi:MAG TPA: PAS domain-containing protein, partial [Vicinamibacterales bacterium]|nr:PAS domain-containing protein [Vicinamibacterales bacterium]
MDARVESSADEVARLRTCVNDLASALASRTLWGDREPPQTVGALLDTLHGVVDAVTERESQQARELAAVTDALRESERNAKSVVDSIPAGASIMTSEGEIEFVNKRISEYFGKTLEDLKTWGTSDAIHPDDRPHALAALTHSLATGDPYDTEERLRRFDGIFRWFRVLGVPLRDTNGRITRWCMLHIDIDKRKRTEEAMRASDLNFQLTVDSIPGMVHTMTAAGEVEFVNQQILDFLGTTREELNHWEVLLHPDDRSRVVDSLAHSVTTGEPFDVEHRVRCADKTYRWLHSRGLPLRDGRGNIVRWYHLLTDIHERKAAEEALRESERESRLIVDSIPGLVAVLTPPGDVAAVNERLVEYCGRSREDLQHWATNDILHLDDRSRVVQLFAGLITSGRPSEWEARVRRFDGVYRWFQFRALPLRDTAGNIVRWYALLTDIDDLKRAEAELRRAYDHLTEAQRLSQTGSFTADLERDEHFWSDEFYRICGFDPGSTVTILRLGEIVHPEDVALYEGAIGRAMAGTDPDFYFRIVTSQGVLKHLRGFAHRIADRPIFVGAVQDVTASKMAQEALNKAGAELARVTRVTTMSALTASIAHEVNQPLSGIITNAGTCLRMLDAVPPDLDGARETARRTIRDGNRASDVITRLRALFIKKEFTLE